MLRLSTMDIQRMYSVEGRGTTMCAHNSHRKNGFALNTPWLKTKELWCIKLQLWYK